MKPDTESRYLSYLRDGLDAATASGQHDRDVVLNQMVDAIRTSLVEGGYDESLVAAECADAQAAADLLRKAVQKSDAVGEPADTSSGQIERVEKPVLRAGANAPTASPVLIFSERLSSRGGRIVLIALVALAYLLPLFLFYREGADLPAPASDGTGLALELRIGVVDFVRDNVTFHVLPVAGLGVLPNGRLGSDLTVVIDAGTGPLTHVFKANAHAAPWTVTAAVDDGDILDYPFDRHHLDLEISARSEDKPVKVAAHVDHVPHGYRIRQQQETAQGDETASVPIMIRRSGTIIFVALLAIVSLLLVTFAALTVAWQVTWRGRKIEFSMMIWTAALLFVIPTARNGLPGNIPPGALIDFAIFFWLQAGVVAAMASLVVTWVRRPAT